MILKIKKGKDQSLRAPTEEIVRFDFELEKLIDDMVATMRKANGVGLAAPQVGVSKKLIVLEFEGDEEAGLKPFPLTILCNPKITYLSKAKRNMVEGCLSFPGMEILVKRPSEAIVEGYDRYGKKIQIKADQLYSRVLQHEIDHLNSTLLIDHIQETPVFFIGTGSLGEESLKALITDPQYKVKLVITGRVSSVSRDKTKNINNIEQLAKAAQIPVITTEKINSPEVIEKIKSTKAKLGIMADFGQIIGNEILSYPSFGVINIHPSLLPRHRGPSPIQQIILDGDTITGVTLILTVNKMDAGPIISQVSVKLSGTETSSILKEYLGRLAANLLLNSLPYYLAGDLKPLEQNDEKATYTHLFNKNDGEVTSETSELEAERKVRAFDSWPKVYTKLKSGKTIQITASHFNEDGGLVIDRVKPEGKKEIPYQDFINGYRTTLTFKH